MVTQTAAVIISHHTEAQERARAEAALREKGEAGPYPLEFEKEEGEGNG